MEMPRLRNCMGLTECHKDMGGKSSRLATTVTINRRAETIPSTNAFRERLQFFPFSRGSRPAVLQFARRATIIHLQARSLPRSWKGTNVGLSAAVERGPSQGARSGSTGPMWVSFPSFIVGALRAQRPYQLPRYPLPRPRVARAQETLSPALSSSEDIPTPLQEGVARLSFTARAERPSSI